MNKNIGIIGNGFVGSAIAAGFSLHANVRIHDQNKKLTVNSFEETINESEFVFICVPTPMDLETRRIDISIITDVLEHASRIINRKDTIFIIKSTVIPGTIENFIKRFLNLRIVFSPEFLTERSAKLDFINTSRIILGGSSDDVERSQVLFRDRFPHTPILKTDVTTAQFIKYMNNSFFATKVSFMNEMKQCADAVGVNWKDTVCGFMLDGRIGNSHIEVPGHDGDCGFGGKCFPKDINAFINYFDDNGIDAKVMKAAWNKNIEVRHYHNWLEIPGAVSFNTSKKLE